MPFPTYLLRCAIRISTDKNGRKRAHYRGGGYPFRWLPCKVEHAEAALAAQAEG